MRKVIGLVMLAVMAGAAAQAPQDFTYRASLDAVPGLNAVALTEGVYRAALTPDLRDLRFFNGRGEALPFAAVATPPTPSAGRRHDLKLVPLPAQPGAQQTLLSDFALRVEKDGARAVIELSSTTTAQAPTQAAADAVRDYLVDLRAQRGVSGQLVLHFAQDAPDFTARVELLGSDDLYAWRTLASAPLVRNRKLGDTIERNVVAVAGLPPFVRVTWGGDVAPRLEGATLVEPATAPPLPRARLAVTRGDNAGSWFVDVPPALPIVRLQLRAPRDNQSVRVRVFRYVDQDAPPRARLPLHARRAPERWRAEGGPHEVFRLDRNGETIESAPFAFAAGATQLRIDAIDNRDFGDALPIVEAEWQPQRLVFAANEPGPYQVAAGNDASDLKRGPLLDLSGMLPADDPAGARLPAARIGDAGVPATAAAVRTERLAKEASWSRYALWGALVAAVGALGFMAWRLAQQIKAGGQASRETEGG